MTRGHPGYSHMLRKADDEQMKRCTTDYRAEGVIHRGRPNRTWTKVAEAEVRNSEDKNGKTLYFAVNGEAWLQVLRHDGDDSKKKVKEVDLYSAFIEVPHTQGAQVRITQC